MTGVNTVYIVTPGAETRADLVAVGIDAAKTAGVAHIVIVSVPAVVAAGELMFKAQFSAIETKVRMHMGHGSTPFPARHCTAAAAFGYRQSQRACCTQRLLSRVSICRRLLLGSSTPS